MSHRWGVGKIQFHKQKSRAPSFDYVIDDPDELANVVVPHCQRWPLLAKKHQDFEIWRHGVMLASAVKHSPMCRNVTKFGHRTRGSRWGPEQYASFVTLQEALATNREFRLSNQPVPEPPTASDSTDSSDVQNNQ